VVPAFRDAAFLTPDAYSGDVNKCGGFLLQYSLAISDPAKILSVIALLSGRALDWAQGYFRFHPIVSTSFTEFMGEFRRIFDHPLRANNSIKRLLNLRQGNRPVSDFIVEFRILAAETGWSTRAGGSSL